MKLKSLINKKYLTEEEDDLLRFKTLSKEKRKEIRIANIKRLLQKKHIKGDLNLINIKEIDSLGNLESIDGDLDLRDTGIKSLGNLERVGGDLNLYGIRIKSLDKLKSVGDIINRTGYLSLAGTGLESLGNLKEVGSMLILYNTEIKSLNNLEYVGSYLDLRGTGIKSLGNLKEVGSNIWISRGMKIDMSEYFKNKVKIV